MTGCNESEEKEKILINFHEILIGIHFLSLLQFLFINQKNSYSKFLCSVNFLIFLQ